MASHDTKHLLHEGNRELTKHMSKTNLDQKKYKI